MNTNPRAKTVLCFGDSNTYGQNPDRVSRYAANERWPGVLQDRLGDTYYVIEDDLGGRTTDLDHFRPTKPSRNGLAYYKGCIDGHKPLDVIVIMLGTNDLKTVYHRQPEDVAQSLKQYPDFTKELFNSQKLSPPKIILVSPPYMDEHAPKFYESMPEPGIYDEVSAQKSRQLAEPLERVAAETGCEFLDVGSIAHPGEDGCHLTKEAHAKLAEAVFAKIKS